MSYVQAFNEKTVVFSVVLQSVGGKRKREREREIGEETQSEFLFSVRRRRRDVARPSHWPLSWPQCASAAETVLAKSLCKFSWSSFLFFFRAYEIPCSNLNRRPLFIFLLQLFLLFLASIVTRAHAACFESWLPESRIGYACSAC